MKIIKILGIVLLVLVLLVVGLGVMKPSVKYGHTIAVDKPINEAWEIYHDASKYDQWLKGFQSMDLISGNPGEAGSKYKIVVKPAPDQPNFEMIETIVSVDKNEQITLLFENEMMKFDQQATFSEKEGKTVINSTSEVHGSGVMTKSMFAAMEMFTGSFQAQEEENYNNLKKVIENTEVIKNEEINIEQ